ncbi:hypothetical protein ACFLX6_02190 [Chloroflexota bacterium]
MRASVVAEKLGIPSVTDLCAPFVKQGQLIAEMEGVPGAPIAEYPSHIDTHSIEQRNRYIEEQVLPQIIKGLTEPPKEVRLAAIEEPGLRDIIFKGTFEEINTFFYDKQWSDGLPIVPPTLEKVEEFLKYTGHYHDEVLGVLPPGNREATVWNVAVNGVMAGCRPEYMPILIAMVEVMAEPRFRIQTAGATPGWEAIVILNGPIVKQLDFNYKVGALRPGFLPNTSVGRFWRLYLRNVAQLLPGSTDKSTWGRNFHVVLAENHEALEEIGWEPLSVQQGFTADDNVVTIQSIRGRGYDVQVMGSTAEENLDMISYALLVFQQNRLYQIRDEHSVLLGLTPLNAAVIARDGYLKKDVKQYLWEHTTLPAHVLEAVGHQGIPWKTRHGLGEDLCDAVKLGVLPKLYCESTDPNRMLPVWRSPDELLIVVSGDPGRNRTMITGSSVVHGLPTSKKIELPANWAELLTEARKK